MRPSATAAAAAATLAAAACTHAPPPRRPASAAPDAGALATAQAPASPDAGAPTTADAGELESDERACDLATGELDAKLEAARACARDAECVVVSAACVAPCGRPLNAARAKQLQPELDALRDRCQERCGKAKCAAWGANKPVCRAGQCEIPH